jgi:hypothetical protein
MKVTFNKPDDAEVGLIKIHAKCSDSCYIKVIGKDGEELYAQDGYVPSFMPGKHYGDYIILDIDPNTGVILNWKKPEQVASDIQNLLNGDD